MMRLATLATLLLTACAPEVDEPLGPDASPDGGFVSRYKWVGEWGMQMSCHEDDGSKRILVHLTIASAPAPEGAATPEVFVAEASTDGLTYNGVCDVRVVDTEAAHITCDVVDSGALQLDLRDDGEVCEARVQDNRLPNAMRCTMAAHPFVSTRER